MNQTCGKKRTEVSERNELNTREKRTERAKEPKGKLARFTDAPTQ